jgi:hypothetical protein
MPFWVLAGCFARSSSRSRPWPSFLGDRPQRRFLRFFSGIRLSLLQRNLHRPGTSTWKRNPPDTRPNSFLQGTKLMLGSFRQERGPRKRIPQVRNSDRAPIRATGLKPDLWSEAIENHGRSRRSPCVGSARRLLFRFVQNAGSPCS